MLLAGGHGNSKAFSTDSTMLQASSLLLDWPDCIRRLVTTCSAELLQAVQRPGLASGYHEIAMRDVETCSGATMRCSNILLHHQSIICSCKNQYHLRPLAQAARRGNFTPGSGNPASANAASRRPGPTGAKYILTAEDFAPCNY